MTSRHLEKIASQNHRNQIAAVANVLKCKPVVRKETDQYGNKGVVVGITKNHLGREVNIVMKYFRVSPKNPGKVTTTITVSARTWLYDFIPRSDSLLEGLTSLVKIVDNSTSIDAGKTAITAITVIGHQSEDSHQTIVPALNYAYTHTDTKCETPNDPVDSPKVTGIAAAYWDYVKANNINLTCIGKHW